MQHRRGVPTRCRNARVSAEILIDKLHVRRQKILARALVQLSPSAVSVAVQLSSFIPAFPARRRTAKARGKKKKSPENYCHENFGGGLLNSLFFHRNPTSLFFWAPLLLASSIPLKDIKDGHIIHIYSKWRTKFTTVPLVSIWVCTHAALLCPLACNIAIGSGFLCVPANWRRKILRRRCDFSSSAARLGRRRKKKQQDETKQEIN